ncbi:tetratricopeptide repeat protein [Luteimonas vadosa]|uniref:PgaA membrane beta barrel domain-containing protein n=1 Tax=Luteimonas vadosa TaxID=1165507 RepID=A0ABP9DTD6_9GAMM
MAQVTTLRERRWLALAVAAALAGGMPLFTTHAQDMGLDRQAREAAWSGRVSEGLALIDRHLATHPDDREARMDRARFLAWSGDYDQAIRALDALGGDDDAMRTLRARIYAWAGWRDTALAINTPVYEADPTDYDAAFTQALAARHGEWPQESLKALANVLAAKPEGKDTEDLVRAVRLPLFSSVGVPVSVYDDSDDIRIRSVGVDANLRLSDQWRLLGYAVEREHSAPATGPFAPVTGGDSVDETRIGIGARYAVSPHAALEFSVGRSSLDPGDSDTIGHAAWTQRTSDQFQYTLRAERDRMNASPRAVSLGVMRNRGMLSTEWRPTLDNLLRTSVALDDLNDGNRRIGATADYRHAVHRSERINVDVGGQVEWFAYSEDPGNGYYSPDHYTRVAPLVSTYIKFNDDVGLYLQGAVGLQRDETFDGWKRAVDVGGELTVGIFTHWQLAARAGYSERLNEFGAYEGTSVGLELRYRFCEFRADRCPP